MSNVTIVGDGNVGGALPRVLMAGALRKHITTADTDAAVEKIGWTGGFALAS